MLFGAGLEMVRRLNRIPPDTAIVNDVLGLTLLNANQHTLFAGMGSVRAIVGTPVARFVEAFAEGYHVALAIGERGKLALELLSASRFEESLRARFLTLVTAIECIAERTARTDEALALVGRFQAQLESSALSRSEKSALGGSLRDLAKESIGSTCKALVFEHCGMDVARFFTRCYKARSELVHSGHTQFDLGRHVHDVEAMAADTILGVATAVA
jgi:hypothetical protein